MNILLLSALMFSSTAVTNSSTTTNSTPALSVQQCVAKALENNAKIGVSAKSVEAYQARLKQVKAIFYPKLAGMLLLAPMYTVTATDKFSNYDVQWKSIKDWGPYTHFEMTLIQPITTFGRADALEDAATNRIAVEKARLREAKLAVAVEVKKLYYANLFAKSMKPGLKQASDTVDKALKQATAWYKKGTGKVQQTDLARLHYAKTQVQRLSSIRDHAEIVSLAALKHTLGMHHTESLTLADQRLPRWESAPKLSKMPDLLLTAAANRPEWAEIKHGTKALEALKKSQLLANAPQFFLGGRFKADWTPTRDYDPNPYHNDIYNGVSGGLALGLNFELDPAASIAQAQQTEAEIEQVAALKRFAETGLPLRVLTAYQGVQQSVETVSINRDAVKTTLKWMLFSGNAYAMGTGEARDVLEGLAAFLESKKDYYQSIFEYYVNQAQLNYAVGKS